MELDALRAQVTQYETLMGQLTDFLSKPKAATVDPSMIQALADHMSQINTSFQNAITSLTTQA
jgi:hypothetical protein